MRIVNPEGYTAEGEYNPYHTRPFLVGHDYGYGHAIVYADTVQDALDFAADADALRSLALTPEDVAELEADGYADDVITYLGNASEPYDGEHIYACDLPNLTPEAFTAMDDSDIFALSRTV